MFSKIYRNMELHLEFASNPDVRARATLSFTLMVLHDDVEADGVISGNAPTARVSIFCSVRCTGRIGLWKDFSFVSDGRASAALR